MCTVCGCGKADGHAHSHRHAHDEHVLDYGRGPAGASAPGQEQGRLVRIQEDILAHNDSHAARNRAWLAAHGVLALNLVSSPGAGKTTLLERTLRDLLAEIPCAVIEGDQQTSRDADRIRATGVPAEQINTGKGCHLDAHMVGHAIDHLAPPPDSLLFIENVGNLVCPAGFDLGEARRVVLASVTEGEDKPLKYPDMFATADLMLVAKIDLLPHLEFASVELMANALRINPEIDIIPVSAKTGDGLDGWYDWLRAAREHHRAGAG